jgi:hypothetical protein
MAILDFRCWATAAHIVGPVSARYGSVQPLTRWHANEILLLRAQRLWLDTAEKKLWKTMGRLLVC